MTVESILTCVYQKEIRFGKDRNAITMCNCPEAYPKDLGPAQGVWLDCSELQTCEMFSVKEGECKDGTT